MVWTKGCWKYHVQILEFTLLMKKIVNSLSKMFRIVILEYETGLKKLNRGNNTTNWPDGSS